MNGGGGTIFVLCRVFSTTFYSRHHGKSQESPSETAQQLRVSTVLLDDLQEVWSGLARL